MGNSQVVRQGTLTPSCVGSNPATPVVKEKTLKPSALDVPYVLAVGMIRGVRCSLVAVATSANDA